MEKGRRNELTTSISSEGSWLIQSKGERGDTGSGGVSGGGGRGLTEANHLCLVGQLQTVNLKKTEREVSYEKRGRPWKERGG